MSCRERILEVCCGSFESVCNAVKGGARRVELCSRLEVDGLTPDPEDLKKVRRSFPDLRVHVLIRCREGNFCYSDSEIASMASDIRTAVSIGADGIVIGALTPGGDVDIPAMRTLLAVCPVPVTFHRAFDVCRDPEGALEEIIELGCKRILTSGQAQTALEGAELIRRLRLKADGRIILLPGGGITPETAAQVLALTGCSELHASASVRFEAADGGEHGFKVTSADKVAAIIAAMDAGSQ